MSGVLEPIWYDDEDVPRYEVHVPPEAFFQRSTNSEKKKVQTITVIQPPTSPASRDTEELERLLQEPDYNLPIDSLIQVSTHETKWIEDLIDPLTKIVTKGRTDEEKEILEKSEIIHMQPEEYAARKSRISAEFPEVKWSQQSGHESSEVIKTYKTPRKIASDSHKTGLQVEADTLQQQGNPPDRRLTLIDLTGNCKGNPFRFRCPPVFRFRFRLPPAFRSRSRHLVSLPQCLWSNDILRHPLPTRFRSRSHDVARLIVPTRHLFRPAFRL